MICIDTNVAIAFLNDRPRGVADRLSEALRDDTVALPAPALHELWYGAANSQRVEANVTRIEIFLRLPIAILPFDADDAREAGFIRAALKSLGVPIGNYDLLIAAQARRRSLTLITANVREFTRVPGLVVIDWGA